MANKKKTARPICPFNHTDCFAWMKNNKCYCLDNTDFKRAEECPFYKNDPTAIKPELIVTKYEEEKTL